MSEINPRIGRIGAFRAMREGVAAAKDGKPVTDCPYDLNGNFEQRVKARYWIRGHARAEMALARKARIEAAEAAGDGQSATQAP